MLDYPLEWDKYLDHLLRMSLAFLLALPVAWNREKHARGAGLRTFPLVSVGACGFMLIGLDVLRQDESLARIIYGIITGIGFIGGGAILKGADTVRGTSTAASIWNTGAIGVAVAWGRFEIAVFLSLFNVLVFYWIETFKIKSGAPPPDNGSTPPRI